MTVDFGIWRSTLGDTHPHRGVDVEMDWWPQATHVVWEAPPLLACVTGGGGGAQQATFKVHLDPLLAGALARWHDRDVSQPVASLDALFAEVQQGFETLAEPFYANELQATAVALTITGDHAAVGSVGLARAWRFRDGRLDPLSEDDTLGAAALRDGAARSEIPEFLHEVSPHAFGRWKDLRANPNVIATDARSGDVFILMSGVASTRLHEVFGLATIIDALAAKPAGAQALADWLGDFALRHAAAEGTRWHVCSRLAIGIAWM